MLLWKDPDKAAAAVDKVADVLKTGWGYNAKQEVDPTSTAWAVGDWLIRWVDQAAAVLTLAEAAKQLPKVAQKGWKTILNKVKDAKSKKQQQALAKEAREYLDKYTPNNTEWYSKYLESEAPSYQQRRVANASNQRWNYISQWWDIESLNWKTMETYRSQYEPSNGEMRTFRNLTEKMDEANKYASKWDPANDTIKTTIKTPEEMANVLKNNAIFESRIADWWGSYRYVKDIARNQTKEPLSKYWLNWKNIYRKWWSNPWYTKWMSDIWAESVQEANEMANKLWFKSYKDLYNNYLENGWSQSFARYYDNYQSPMVRYDITGLGNVKKLRSAATNAWFENISDATDVFQKTKAPFNSVEEMINYINTAKKPTPGMYPVSYADNPELMKFSNWNVANATEKYNWYMNSYPSYLEWARKNRFSL